MKNIQKRMQWFFSLALIFMIPALFAFTTPPQPNETSCQPPTVTKTAQGSNSVSFSWSPVNGATQYAVWYVRKNDNYTSGITYTNGTAVSFSGLPAGTYSFHFATVCGTELSEGIIIEELVMM